LLDFNEEEIGILIRKNPKLVVFDSTRVHYYKQWKGFFIHDLKLLDNKNEFKAFILDNNNCDVLFKIHNSC